MKRFSKGFLTFILGCVLMSDLAYSSPKFPDLSYLLPAEVHGWRSEGRDETYDGQTIFDYINGFGEIYLAYNFRFLLVRRYEKPSQPRLTVDLFDMGSAEDAFGIFSFEREETSPDIGQDSDYAAGMLRFWKGQFFVTVTAEKETPESKEAVLALGKAIAEAIQETGQYPEVLRFLPKKGLISKKVLFFRSYMILNHHFFVADRDILNLSLRAEGVLAPYRIGKEKVSVVVIRYPTQIEAKKAWETFASTYLREGQKAGMVRTANNKWTTGRLFGRILVIIFDALDSNQATILLKEVLNLIELSG
jgi:hypothetical protein